MCMALTSIFFITAYETRADSFWKRLSAPVPIWNAQTLPKPRRNIQLIMPAQELYYVACLLCFSYLQGSLFLALFMQYFILLSYL